MRLSEEAAPAQRRERTVSLILGVELSAGSEAQRRKLARSELERYWVCHGTREAGSVRSSAATFEGH